MIKINRRCSNIIRITGGCNYTNCEICNQAGRTKVLYKIYLQFTLKILVVIMNVHILILKE